MTNEIKILILEDVPEDAEMIERHLRRFGLTFTSKRVETESDFLKALTRFSPDIILADYLLPSFNAVYALSDKKSVTPDIPFIVVTGSVSEDIAVECMKAGAEDYILKTNLKRLGPAIDSALRRSEIVKGKKIAERRIIQLLRAIEQSPTSKIITDIKGNIEYVNPKFEEITGYSSKEIIGKNPRFLKSGEMKIEAYKVLWETITSGKTWKGDILNRKKNGELYWVSTSISPVKSENGSIINFVCNQEDITEKKNFLSELEVAKKLAEDANKIKTHLLENLSHEFRTPLNGILGFSDIIANESDNAEIQNMAMGIHKSGKRLLDTLTAILDLSQLGTHEHSITLTSLGVASLINSVIEEHAPYAKLKGIGIQTKFNEFNASVIGDERLLTKTFSYVLDNAIKFTNEGTITIEVSLIEKNKFHFVKFDFTDTGIGIKEEDQSIIFEEFRQTSEGLGRSYEGTGIGLYLAKKVIGYLKGEITVKSVFGVGSTFSITIPADMSNMSSGDQTIETIKKEKIENTSDKKNILSVEDNLENRTIITKFLEGLFEVEDAVNAIEAIQKTKKRKYDLILMDISLEGAIDGRTAAKEIRKINGYDKIPIIAITGYALFADKEQFLKEGFDGYLAKPYRKKQLIDIINQHIG